SERALTWACGLSYGLPSVSKSGGMRNGEVDESPCWPAGIPQGGGGGSRSPCGEAPKSSRARGQNAGRRGRTTGEGGRGGNAAAIEDRCPDYGQARVRLHGRRHQIARSRIHLLESRVQFPWAARIDHQLRW